jgi:hypothetical protein
MVPRPQSSAAGALSLLDEPNPEFKQYALAALNPLVPQFWSEISEHITTMYAYSLSKLSNSQLVFQRIYLREQRSLAQGSRTRSPPR